MSGDIKFPSTFAIEVNKNIWKDTMLGQAKKYYSALEQRSMVYLLYLPGGRREMSSILTDQ